MKSLDKIPTSKIERASRLLQTGAKVGVNYLKYYGDKITKTEEEARNNLDQANASDIYDGLKEMKGSALKVAQMLSMEKSILPQAYVDKFSLAQFSVPPLSAPLVEKTFKQYFGKSPKEMFDTFTPEAINAASIGQVHLATKNGKKLAVKIQYPGVGKSISSDLAMVKPIAMKMLNIKGKESDLYFKEVESKLLEETDYQLELANSQSIAQNCKDLENVKFPSYYPALSCERIITMDYMEGQHLSQFCEANKDSDAANLVGQTLWDFYQFQMHQLRKIHADPHPGNFLVSEKNELIALDFGCMKELPEDFYIPFFQLTKRENIENPTLFEEKLYALEILKRTDSDKDKVFFTKLFKEALVLLCEPFNAEYFDFSDPNFFARLTTMGEQMVADTELRKMDGSRGSKHFIYVNRTFFGLYNLMHELKATNVKINNLELAIEA
jgi:predicted unusual protein kinase regulating ubiquinone biosynthesis (AarF/ABC1/UbiB family)